MNNILQRTLSSLKSDGFALTLVKTGRILLWHSGMRESETLLFSCDLNKLNGTQEIKPLSLPPGFELRVVSNRAELDSLEASSAKMASLPLDLWFGHGAVALTLIRANYLAAYTWIHFRRHSVVHAGTLDLGNNAAFIGPFFTDPANRGNGYYYLLMDSGIRYLKQHRPVIEILYGSCNRTNLATLKVCVRSGFDVEGCVRARKKGKTLLNYKHNSNLRDILT